MVIKALGNKEIAHRETGVMPNKVCFTKTLGLILKIECNDLYFNKLYLYHDNIRQSLWYIPPLTGHSSPSSNLKDPEESRTALSWRGTILLPSEKAPLPAGCYGMLPGRTRPPPSRATAPEAVSWAGFLNCLIISMHLI